MSTLSEVVCTDDQAVAFKDIDVAILVGAMPRREGMERKDLLAANVKIFKEQGESLDKYAKKTVKVIDCYCLLMSLKWEGTIRMLPVTLSDVLKHSLKSKKECLL